MDFGFLDTLSIIGALGFFIYGMKVMSEGIQKIAGSRLRKILSAMTSNRFKGVLTGFLVTSIIQSSSATTVMVVSFVNAGLLSLIEAIGVIMGANIGTTVTAWLISIIGFKVKISALSLPIIAIGFPMLFSPRSNLKSFGEVLIGFALLFMGLETLKTSVPDLRSNPQVLEFLASYTDLGILSILLFIVIGTILTIVVQSSSASMALTLVMTNNGWIPFEMSAAMILGENIGTTITANLASLVGNVFAKRAARAHLVFNIFGVVWMLLFFSFFIKAIDFYMVKTQGVSPLDPDQYTSIPVALSIFHTSFNIINTLILVWFANFIARIVNKMVKSKGDEEFRLEHLSGSFVATPEISILEARKEIAKFGKITSRLSEYIRLLLEKPSKRKHSKLMEKVKKYEELTDRLEVEVGRFLSKTHEGNVSEESSIKIRAFLGINHHLERIGDIFYQISKSINKKLESDNWFSETQTENLTEMFDLIDKAFDTMNKNLDSEYSNVSIKEATETEDAINEYRKKLRQNHLYMIETGEIDIQSGLIYNEILTWCERIGDHIYYVSKGIAGKDT
ncbi:MAG: Na/Pi cotransporter family protein [Bacteroidota bacterium]